MTTLATQSKLLIGALLALPLSLAAQEVGPGGDATALVQEYEIGGYYLSDDSWRFGKLTGLTDEGTETLLNFRIEKNAAWDSDDGASWRLQGWRLGLDSRRIEYAFSDHGTQSFTADYREIPNHRFDDGMTPYLDRGNGLFELPANWVGEVNKGTSGFATLQQNLHPLSVGIKRKRLDLDYDRNINRNWRFNLDWRHEVKEGERTLAATMGSSGGNPRAVILPAPVDYQTDIMEATFDYGNSRYQFGLGVYASFFSQGDPALTWRNAFGARSGWADGVGYPDGYGSMALEPDNEAMQFRVYGGLNLSPTTRISADLSFGSMEQDEPLLPYTVNPALAVEFPLPRASADAKMDTRHANIRLTARPLPRLGLVASYTLDDRDNRTPRETWIYIGGDSQDQKPADDGRINLPYSYRKDKYDLTATWRAGNGIRLKGGIQRFDYDRAYLEVESSDETRAFAGLQVQAWETGSLSLDVVSSERDVDEYVGNRPLLLSVVPGTHEETDFENHPLLRKYFETDRDRDEVRVRADFFPQPGFSVGLEGRRLEDDYGDGYFGLNSAEITSVSVDAALTPAEGVTLSAFYTAESYEAEQSSRSWSSRANNYLDADRNWWAESEDDVDTWNVSLKFNGLGERLGSGRDAAVGFDYTRSEVESDIVITAGPALSTDPLPRQQSRMQSWSVFGRFDINDRNAIRLSYEKQKLSTADFYLDGVAVDTLENVLLLGESAPNYDLSLLMLSWSYRHR